MKEKIEPKKSIYNINNVNKKHNINNMFRNKIVQPKMIRRNAKGR
ncbi:MAG: hypothetical protein PHN54_01275 [Bacilli bacterium]|nr:hypothetical protein [Bacilli bacterium]